MTTMHIDLDGFSVDVDADGVSLIGHEMNSHGFVGLTLTVHEFDRLMELAGAILTVAYDAAKHAKPADEDPDAQHRLP